VKPTLPAHPRRLALAGGVCLVLISVLTACARTPSAQAAKFVAKGQKRIAEKDYQRAALEFRNAISLVPKDAEPLYQLALAHLYSGDYDSGVQELRQVLELDPKHTGAHLKLVELRAGAEPGESGANIQEIAHRRLQAILDSPDAAASQTSASQTSASQASIDELERDFQHRPTDAQLQNHLLRGYILAGRFPDAERSVQKILAINQSHRKRAQRVSLLKKLAIDIFTSPEPDPEADKKAQCEPDSASEDPECSSTEKKDANDLDGSSDVMPLVMRAQVYLATVRAKEAEQDLIQALARNSHNVLAHYLLSKVHQVHGAENARRHELSQAVDFAPNWLRPRLELAHSLTEDGQPAAAIEILEDMPREQQSDLAVITEFNWALLALDDRIGLRRSLNRVVDQKNPDILIQEGILRLRVRDMVGARRFFQLALQIKPEDIRAADAVAQSYFSENKPDLALGAVRDYASRYPKSGGLQYLLGTWLVRLNYPGEARTAFDAAINAAPGFLAALEKRADLDIASGNPDAALQAIASIAAAPGGESSAELALGMIEERTGGNRESAIAHYRKALNADPDNIVALNNLAFHLAAAGNRSDEALTLALRARKLDPSNASVNDTLGWAYYNTGAYQLAVRYLQEAVAQEVKAGRKYRLAMALYKTGEREKARASLRDALKIDASAPEAAVASQLINGA
jgi:tetratricopeptide (TPR) repeat protein